MPKARATPRRSRRASRPAAPAASAVLDQGICITGDLRIKLLGVNLLPIQVRLLVSSKDLAAALGLDWWRDRGHGRPGRAANGRAGGR